MRRATLRYIAQTLAIAGLTALYAMPSRALSPTPAVVALRAGIQSFALPSAHPAIPRCAAEATQLIVRWEVTSPQVYTRRWQGVVWPGGASGPTTAIGYDHGHQTVPTITQDWAGHPDVARLSTASGVTGTRAQARVNAGEWRGVLTPYPYALQVFQVATLPSYTAAARRALSKDDFDALPCGAQAALVSLGYNRGWQMSGPRRVEMRTIRDVCLPRQDAACIADQIAAMQRLWPDTPGLQARRRDEARVARGAV